MRWSCSPIGWKAMSWVFRSIPLAAFCLPVPIRAANRPPCCPPTQLAGSYRVPCRNAYAGAALASAESSGAASSAPACPFRSPETLVLTAVVAVFNMPKRWVCKCSSVTDLEKELAETRNRAGPSNAQAARPMAACPVPALISPSKNKLAPGKTISPTILTPFSITPPFAMTTSLR